MIDFDQLYVLLLTGFIAPLLTYAVVKLCAWIDAKTGTIKSEKAQKALKEARIELENAVKKAIVQVNETFVIALKADGNFSEEDARLALMKSIEITKNIMSETALNILVNASIALDDAIKTEIEIQLPLINTPLLPTTTTTIVGTSSGMQAGTTMVKEVITSE